MDVILDQPVTLDFTTHDPLSGAVSDADIIPSCEVFENQTDIPILTPAATKRTEKTGNYRVTFDATVGNGFEIGKSYNIIAEATVNAVKAKARIASFTLTGPPLPMRAPAHFQI